MAENAVARSIQLIFTIDETNQTTVTIPRISTTASYSTLSTVATYLESLSVYTAEKLLIETQHLNVLSAKEAKG